MWLTLRLFRRLRRHVRQVSWLTIAAAFVLHMLLSWGLLALAGESKLVAADTWGYYYMTTATTIGYGDLTPSTPAGRLVVALLLMPGAVALFAAMLAKISGSLLFYWQRHLRGKMSYSTLSGHTVVVGWRGNESLRLIELLLADAATDDEGIVLVAEGLSENPMPEELRYVATLAYSERAVYDRAAVARAARVIVAAQNDDQTLAAVLAVMSHQPGGHVVAHFQQATAAALVNALYPQVECTRPMNAELIARAAQDPGSSLVTLDLLSSADGQAAMFAISAPTSGGHRHADLARRFAAHQASLLGFKAPGAAAPTLEPAYDGEIPAGATLYYLGSRRLDAARLFAPQPETQA